MPNVPGNLRLPLTIKALEESFIITDAAGIMAAAVYFDDGCNIRRATRNRMNREQAEAVAKRIARALTDGTER